MLTTEQGPGSCSQVCFLILVQTERCKECEEGTGTVASGRREISELLLEAQTFSKFSHRSKRTSLQTVRTALEKARKEEGPWCTLKTGGSFVQQKKLVWMTTVAKMFKLYH